MELQERQMIINGEREAAGRIYYDRPVVIIAMKGHPGTGKSTIARSIASALGCPLLDKDDIRDSTFSLQDALLEHDHRLLNDLSYEVLWRMASTQLSLGISVVVDSPLSRKAHLDRLRQLAADHNRAGGPARLLIVECKPKDSAEWRRRLQERGAAAEHGSWHKPATWEDLEKLLDQYNGCYEYDVERVPRLVLDTTAKNVGVEEHLASVLKFVQSNTMSNNNNQHVVTTNRRAQLI